MNEKELISIIENWIDLIVDGNIDNAFAQLSSNEQCQSITKETFSDTLSGLKLTSPKSMNNNEHAVIRFYEHEQGTNVEYGLPINNDWSTMTAIFEFFEIDDQIQFSLVELDEI